jgi:hypothetical protein
MIQLRMCARVYADVCMYVCISTHVCLCVCVCALCASSWHHHGIIMASSWHHHGIITAEVLSPQTDANNTASVAVDTRRMSSLLNLDRIAWDQAVLCE